MVSLIPDIFPVKSSKIELLHVMFIVYDKFEERVIRLKI